jgi:hypothetical protein
MTNQQHPITPPYELIEEWIEQFKGDHPIYVAIQAAQWGADQELEACCEWVEAKHWIEPEFADELRTSRRPKPPSLKEQALSLVEQHEDGWRPSPKDWDTIRRALEALPND